MIKLVESLFYCCRYPCFVTRYGDDNHFCGYVGIDKSNPLYGKKVDKIYRDLDYVPSVHGGITYSEKRNPITREKDEYWWLGFDCTHGMDWNPSIGRFKESWMHEWTQEEVESETAQLAIQLRYIEEEFNRDREES